MKLHGKALALMLAASMILGTATTAFATEPTTGEDSNTPVVTSTEGDPSTGGPDQEVTETVTEVKDAAELKAAVGEGKDVKLTDDIILDETLTITSPLTLDGNGHSLTVVKEGENAKTGHIITVSGVTGKDALVHLKNLTVKDSKGNDEAFGIQIYKSTAMLTDVTINNSACGGLLVNGSTVTVSGLTLSGNTWGGIEVSKGTDVTEKPVLIVKDEITYTPSSADEWKTAPVIWVDGVSKLNGDYEVRLPAGSELAPKTVNDQIHYVIPGTVDTAAALAEKIKAGESVKLGSDIKLDETLIIKDSLKLDGNGFKLSLDNNAEGAHKHAIQIGTDEGAGAVGEVTIANLTINGITKGYGIHAYKSDVVIKDVTINDAKAGGGLLVNGSDVTVDGLTLAGNVWGGIEVAKGTGVTEPSTLTVLKAIDSSDSPIIWIDGKTIAEAKTAGITVKFENEDNDLVAVDKKAADGETDQVHYLPVDKAVGDILDTLDGVTEESAKTTDKPKVTAAVTAIQNMDNEAVAKLAQENPTVLADAEKLYKSAYNMTVDVTAPEGVMTSEIPVGLALAVPVAQAENATVKLVVVKTNDTVVESALNSITEGNFDPVGTAFDIKIQVTKNNATSDLSTVLAPVTITMKLPEGVTATNSQGQALVMLHFDNNTYKGQLTVTVDGSNFTFTAPSFSTFILGYGDEIVVTPTVRKRTMSENDRKAYQLWNETVGKIRAAKDGDTVTVQAASWVRYLPSRVMISLAKHPGVTLKIDRAGETFIIEKALTVEPNRVYYPFETLAEKLEAAAKAEAEAAPQEQTDAAGK